jgi:endonuclease/exonuclease/phosphatase family metal-dependent hydrolase
VIRTFQGRLVQAKPLAKRRQIADRIRAIDVDVLCVQEVEDTEALREFNVANHGDGELGGLYPHLTLIEGNDPRLIDVGVLSKRPLGSITSWQHTRHPEDPKERVFSRDLLEIDVLDPKLQRVVLKIFTTHPKSQVPPNEQVANDRKRRRQAEMAARIIAKRTSPKTAFLICGDMNDIPGSPPLAALEGSAALTLTNALANPTETRPYTLDTPPPATKSWTSRFREDGRTDFDLFDQIWLGPALAPKQTGAFIDRRTAKGGDGSDHDPAWVTLDL